MNLYQLLNSTIELDCQVVIGSEKMPSDILWGEEGRITQEGYLAFRSLMDCEATYNEADNILEIPEGNPAEGKEFIRALDGLVADKYRHAWFSSYGDYAACECDKCDRVSCIHRDSQRRLLRSSGGQELCPLLHEYW